MNKKEKIFYEKYINDNRTEDEKMMSIISENHKRGYEKHLREEKIKEKTKKKKDKSKFILKTIGVLVGIIILVLLIKLAGTDDDFLKECETKGNSSYTCEKSLGLR